MGYVMEEGREAAEPVKQEYWWNGQEWVSREGRVSKSEEMGETASQIVTAPKKSVYVWIKNDVRYPTRLARHLGREDLEIVGPGWVLSEQWRGRVLTGFVVDHAMYDHYAPGNRIWPAIDGARSRVVRELASG